MIVTHREIQTACTILAQGITKQYDLILTITKGGLIPTYYIAKQLNINVIEVLNINSYHNTKRDKLNDTTYLNKDFTDKKVLLIDDLVDTGRTIQYIKDNYKFKELDIVTLFHKRGSIITPDYCYLYNIQKDKWIDFEYEK